MSKNSIIILPPSDDSNNDSSVDSADLFLLLSEDYAEELGDLHALYEHVSSPKVHIKDKINALLRLHMFYSKSMLAGNNVTGHTVSIYRARKEALNDLQRMIEILNDYTSVDNFDIEHPLYSKSLSMIIELILTCVKANVDTPQFDSVVRDVATSMPGTEARIKRLIEDSTTEEILSMQSNPLMDSYRDNRDMYEQFIKNYDLFQEFLRLKNA